jgi:anti-sigma factor RsiW
MNTQEKEEHNEIETLLPWHAAGTLSRRDAQRVEDALKRDPELARRYGLVREELADTIHLNESLGAPSARAMDKLFAKIDAEPARKPAVSLNLGARVSIFFASLQPRTLAWSASAAALVLLLQGAFIVNVMIKDKGATYETASAPADVAKPGSYALVRFQPQATADDIAKYLEAHKLSIVSGPTVGGLYRVQIAPTKLTHDELGSMVKQLQDTKVVGFMVTTD